MEMEKMMADVVPMLQKVGGQLAILNNALMTEGVLSEGTALDRLINALGAQSSAVAEQNRLTRSYIEVMEAHTKALNKAVEAMRVLEDATGEVVKHRHAMEDHCRGMQKHADMIAKHIEAMTR